MGMPGTKHSDTEHESYFIPMTDIMIGMLFIFIIIMVFIAFQVQTEKDEIETLDQYSQQAQEHRKTLLERVREVLAEEGIQHLTIDYDQGILRLPEGVLFASAVAEIRPNSKPHQIAQRIAGAFHEVLPCSVFQNSRPPDLLSKKCQKENPDKIFVESIFIEGHTDNVPIVGGVPGDQQITNNMRLSARRATNTYQVMAEHEPEILGFQSPDDKQILAASAYGDTRPLNNNQSEVEKKQNRRIDIRILMYVLESSSDREAFQTRLNNAYQ